MKVLTKIRDALTPEFTSGEKQTTAGGVSVQRYASSGGAFNPLSGMGGDADKGDATIWSPSIYLNHRRSLLEVVYVESWAAGRFINMPVDDMFIRGRSWVDEDDTAIQTIEDAQKELRYEIALPMAMKAARLHGTGLLLIITIEAPIESPLEINKIKQGDFKSLLAFDRHDAKVKSYYSDIRSPKYGQPETYTITPRCLEGPTEEFDIHESRTVRFDGIRPLTSDGWSAGYKQEWGISELIPALKTIAHDAGLSGAIAHLVHEASVPVIRTEGFSNTIQGNNPIDEVSAEQLGSRVSTLKSIYRTMFLDKTDEFSRESVNFGSLPELMDKFAARLAAIAGVPATRFLSQSPAGLNSTGDSDMRNYAIEVSALQKRILTEPLSKLDAILARHIGLAEPPEYVWNSLVELSEKEKVEASKLRAETLNAAVMSGGIDENEWRERMTESGDELFGKLGPIDDDELERRRGGDPEGGDGDDGGDDGKGGGDE